MSKQILIVAAHTDDEALGCAGTIARHVAEGDTVNAVFMADGVSSRPQADKAEARQRQAAADNALKILGIQNAEFLGLPDNRLDSLPLLEVVQPLEVALSRFQPDIIYTHHHGDLNIDHRITHQAVMTACRPQPGSTVREIYSFEVLSSTEWNTPGEAPFLPNCHVDISAYLEKKRLALEAYALEMRESPHSRNIDHALHLARHRGHSVGVEAAEAFMVVRLLR